MGRTVAEKDDPAVETLSEGGGKENREDRETEEKEREAETWHNREVLILHLANWVRTQHPRGHPEPCQE